MNQTQKIFYIISPFAAGFVAKLVFKDEQSYWFFVGVFCIASLLIYSKFILPYQENRYDAIFNIDPEATYNEKKNDKTAYIPWFHILVLVALIIWHFTEN
ncbi:hypothetical protein [Flavobacterium sp.]|uniref:hypothetical protein n=1 Tax=Flavobacterium sp. TaxID=239 RepID=UPI00261B0050|nr:hypothetical protein [Flavobacterium sp.]